MHPPHGPHRISSNGQVVVPKEVLESSGLEAGDSVYVQALDEPEGAVMIVPAAVAARWFESGKAVEDAHTVH